MSDVESPSGRPAAAARGPSDNVHLREPDVAPKAAGVPADFRPDHAAVALTVPNTGGRRLYYGSCRHGDFVARKEQETAQEAEADVAEHLAEVRARPHRPYVPVITSFLGMCDAGDLTAAEVRDSWGQAAADVAGHVADMHPLRDGP